MGVPNQELHRIATTCIIFRPDGCVLILKRAPHKKEWPNIWTVPGGGFQTDDYVNREPTHIGDTHQWYNSLEQSVHREVFEETGLHIWKPWLVCDLSFIRNDGVPVVVLSYAADLRYSLEDLHPDSEPVVTLDQDATEYLWINLEGARHYPLIPGIYHELELAFDHWQAT